MNRCDICKKRMWFWQITWIGEEGDLFDEFHENCIMGILFNEMLSEKKLDFRSLIK